MLPNEVPHKLNLLFSLLLKKRLDCGIWFGYIGTAKYIQESRHYKTCRDIMALTRQQKEELLKSIMRDWAKAKSAVFSTYQGIPVKEFSALRRELRKSGAKLKIAKKTLVRLAARKLKYPELPESLLPGAVSITFGFDDEVSAAKVINNFAKIFNIEFRII